MTTVDIGDVITSARTFNPARVINKTENIFKVADAGFNLQSLANFPYTAYLQQVSKYDEWEKWFTGEALVSESKKGGEKADRYPIKVNPLKSIILKHAFALFGEYPETDPGQLVHFRLLARDIKSDEAKTAAQLGSDVLNHVWYESNGGAIMMENGIISQYCGGCVFGAYYLPELRDQLLYPFRIERIVPKEFFGVPYENNPWKLKEAWIIRKITAETAREYGVIISSPEGYYIEHWTPTEQHFMINGQSLMVQVWGESVEWGGVNPNGFVPFVYIPHIRSSGFLGSTMVTDSIMGLTRELNLRMGDIGDAVNDESHGFTAMRNVKGSPDFIRLKNGLPVLNLGSTQGITGNENAPDIFSVQMQPVSQTMVDFTEVLYSHIRRETNVPAVADGEDQSSQRSALNLEVKFWPLTSHTKMERVLWSAGLNSLNRMLLSMMEKQGYGGITQEHLQMRAKTNWYPILPKDRQQLIQEVVQRVVNKLGSIQTMMEKLGDIDDVEEETQKMMEWMEFENKLKLEQQEASAKIAAENAPKKVPTGGSNAR